MDLKSTLVEIYEKYDSKVVEAHMKIIQIENIYKNKNYKEKENIISQLDNIIEEATNDN